MMTISCCAECGEEGVVNLKVCKACMLVKYCNANYQRNHWPKHKKPCKQRAAKLHDEALFKDPPPKEECPICFLPMPPKLISCIWISLPPVTILSSVLFIASVPIYDFAMANAKVDTEEYDECCGKSICRGCGYSVICIGQNSICPFCNSDFWLRWQNRWRKKNWRNDEVGWGKWCRCNGCSGYWLLPWSKWFAASLAGNVFVWDVFPSLHLQTCHMSRRHVGDMSLPMSPTRRHCMSARVSKRHDIWRHVADTATFR